MTGFVFAGLNTAVNHQRVVPILKQEGLAKDRSLFINLGLTGYGAQPRSMKEGLLAYIDEDKRSVTTMVSLKKKMWSKKSAPSQGVWTVRFDRAYLLQAILTVAKGL